MPSLKSKQEAPDFSGLLEIHRLRLTWFSILMGGVGMSVQHYENKFTKTFRPTNILHTVRAPL